MTKSHCHLKIRVWWKSTNIQRKKQVRYKLKYTSKKLGTGSSTYLGAEVKIVSLDKIQKACSGDEGSSVIEEGATFFSLKRRLKIIRQSEEKLIQLPTLPTT